MSCLLDLDSDPSVFSPGINGVETMDQVTAKQINELMVDLMARCDESVRSVMTTCSDDEYRRYRRAVGKIMGIAVLDILNPLYEQFPELKPGHFKAADEQAEK